ncbi:MAG: hypothetical protein JWM95_2011 [Gemmatimonadetes bacterium]|nr:hypothetical protein [Gemmatimonadota bacterium]
MYAGHAAIALIIKARNRDVPMLPLVLACYGPDFLDILLMIPAPRPGTGPYSHSIPAVLLGGAIAAGLYAFFARRPGALAIFIGWIVHWPADAFTGVKPVTDLDSSIGFDLYHHFYADFALEALLTGLACWLYWRSLGREPQHRRPIIVLAAVLLALQAGFDVTLSELEREPESVSLAHRGGETHFPSHHPTPAA